MRRLANQLTTENIFVSVADYQAAILKIANIYESFDTVHPFTLWGYGGLINDARQPFFTMGENLASSDAVVQAYDIFFAPDNPYFSLGPRAEMRHVVQAAMYRAIRSNQQHHCYTTLVILSTGEINDLQQTVDSVCSSAEDAPLSIVVIGVGGKSFKNIEKLMGDESGKLRHSNGVPVALDVVQFVAFNDYHGSASRCAAAALRDVPEQFVQHFLNAGVKPKPPQAMPDFEELLTKLAKDKKMLKNGEKKVKKKKGRDHGEDVFMGTL